MVAKLLILRHIYKKSFSVCFSRFLKNMGIKNEEFDNDFESVEESAKSSSKKSYRWKTFAYSNKSLFLRQYFGDNFFA